MSEITGLIHGLMLDGQGKATSATWSEVQAWAPDGQVLWVHLDRTVDAAAQWLRDDSGIDKVVVEALLSSSTRPRCTDHDGGVLLTLRGVNLNPGADPEDMVSLRVWAEPKRVVTLRREKLMAIDDIVRQLELGKGPRNEGEFLSRVAHRLTERMGPVIDDVADTLDGLEDRIVDPEQEESRDDLTVLRRQVIALRRFLGPQRVALLALFECESGLLGDDDRVSLRETANKISRYVEDLEAARERALVLQEEIVAQLTQRLNSRIYVLTVIAAIVLPLSLLAGFFGMNVGGIPLSESRWGLAVVTAALVGLGALLAVVLRRLKWL